MVKWGSVARPKQNLEPFSPDVDVSYSYLLELVIVILVNLFKMFDPGFGDTEPCLDGCGCASHRDHLNEAGCVNQLV